VFPVKYELGPYIPEDGILHSHRRENLKCYLHSFPDTDGKSKKFAAMNQRRQGPRAPAHQHTSTQAHQHTSTPAHHHTSTQLAEPLSRVQRGKLKTMNSVWLDIPLLSYEYS
jgi:hypothetical protein